jgi:hypothetical protein
VGDFEVAISGGFWVAIRGKRDKSIKDKEKIIDELYRQIGQLKVENDWLKKKAVLFDR